MKTALAGVLFILVAATGLMLAGAGFGMSISAHRAAERFGVRFISDGSSESEHLYCERKGQELDCADFEKFLEFLAAKEEEDAI